MENIAVVFNERGARIFHGIDPAEYREVPNCLINPVIPRGVPPHHWALGPDGTITVISPEHIKFREAFLHRNQQPIVVKRSKVRFFKLVAAFAGGALVHCLIQLFLSHPHV